MTGIFPTRPVWTPTLGRPLRPASPRKKAHRRLGQLSSSQMTSGVMVAGGLGALYFSRKFTPPWNIVALIGGISLAGLGLINIIQGAALAEAIQTEEGDGPRTTTAKQVFNNVLATIERPKMHSTEDYTFFGGRYPVTLAFSNPSPSESVSFLATLEAKETAFNSLGFEVGTKSGVIWDEYVTLGPGREHVPQLNAELVHNLNGYPYYTMTFRMELTLTKTWMGPRPEDRIPVFADKVVFFAK